MGEGESSGSMERHFEPRKVVPSEVSEVPFAKFVQALFAMKVSVRNGVIRGGLGFALLAFGDRRPV